MFIQMNDDRKTIININKIASIYNIAGQIIHLASNIDHDTPCEHLVYKTQEERDADYDRLSEAVLQKPITFVNYPEHIEIQQIKDYIYTMKEHFNFDEYSKQEVIAILNSILNFIDKGVIDDYTRNVR